MLCGLVRKVSGVVKDKEEYFIWLYAGIMIVLMAREFGVSIVAMDAQGNEGLF